MSEKPIIRKTTRLEGGDTVVTDDGPRRLRRVAKSSTRPGLGPGVLRANLQPWDVVFEGGDTVVSPATAEWEIVGEPMTPDPEPMTRESAGEYVTHDGLFAITGGGNPPCDAWDLWEGGEGQTLLASFDRVADARKALARVRRWHAKRVRQLQTGREGVVEMARPATRGPEKVEVTVTWDDGERAAYTDPMTIMEVIR